MNCRRHKNKGKLLTTLDNSLILLDKHDLHKDSPCGSSRVDLADHGLPQSLQHLALVVIKVSVDLVDGSILHHPQLALRLGDEPGVVADDDHSWRERGRERGGDEGKPVEKEGV